MNTPSVILSEAKDLIPLTTAYGLDGDEMLRFAQHDGVVVILSEQLTTECGLDGDEVLRFAQDDPP